MKRLYFKTDALNTIRYPVGENIVANKPIILSLIKKFASIKRWQNKRINLLCAGSSGSIIATAFAFNIPNQCNIVHVKKPGEKSNHCNYEIMLYEENAINVMVDDFIATGGTLNRIFAELKECLEEGISIDCVAVCGRDKATHLDFMPKVFLCRETD